MCKSHYISTEKAQSVFSCGKFKISILMEVGCTDRLLLGMFFLFLQVFLSYSILLILNKENLVWNPELVQLVWVFPFIPVRAALSQHPSTWNFQT